MSRYIQIVERVGRVGILGGSFNPIHHAHLFTAEEAAAAMRLDRVLLVPAAQSPFKQRASVSAGDRLEMVRRAAAGNSLLDVSTIEIDRPAPSYTVDTVESLSRMYTGSELFVILGSDALTDLLGWRDPERLLDLAHFLVVSRPGHALEVPRALADHLGPRTERIVLLPTLELPISSTEIRRRVAEGEPIRYLVPDAVESYIRARRLYRERTGDSPP